jgi:adenylate cyclase
MPSAPSGPGRAICGRIWRSALIYLGRPEEAHPYLRTALTLGPRDPNTRLVLLHMAMAYYDQKDYPAAVAAARRCIDEFPAYPHSYMRWAAAALGQADRIDAARAALARTVAVAPQIFERFCAERPAAMPADGHRHLLDGFRKAGWNG